MKMQEDEEIQELQKLDNNTGEKTKKYCECKKGNIGKWNKQIDRGYKSDKHGGGG